MNRRSRTRFKTDLTVNVSCADLRNGSCKARLSDLSFQGLSLIIEEELPSASEVKVEWGTATFTGELIYCRPHGHEFLIGLKLEDRVYASINAIQ